MFLLSLVCITSDPDWASINLGIFLCIKCAGVHRNLGVHYSKVRSIDLDTTCWDVKQINVCDIVLRFNAMQSIFAYVHWLVCVGSIY